MRRAAAGTSRLVRAWRSLPHEHRLAAMAAIGLFVTLFLPWYQETVVSARRATSVSVTGWGAFSLVEAVVLLLAAGVLVLLFRRGEGRPVRLPIGEGRLITAAGACACVLVIWRIFERQSVQVKGPGAAISGIEWGIFIALAVAAWLTYAGHRIRVAHLPARPPSDEQPTDSFEVVQPPRSEGQTRRPPRPKRLPADQLTIPIDERSWD